MNADASPASQPLKTKVAIWKLGEGVTYFAGEEPGERPLFIGPARTFAGQTVMDLFHAFRITKEEKEQPLKRPAGADKFSPQGPYFIQLLDPPVEGGPARWGLFQASAYLDAQGKKRPLVWNYDRGFKKFSMTPSVAPSNLLFTLVDALGEESGGATPG